MAKLEDELISDLELSRAGCIAKYKHAEKMAKVPKAQSLSAIEAIDHRVIPPTYRNQYEKLKQRDPAKAQEFWDKWAFDPRPKPRDPYELEKRVLSRVLLKN